MPRSWPEILIAQEDEKEVQEAGRQIASRLLPGDHVFQCCHFLNSVGRREFSLKHYYPKLALVPNVACSPSAVTSGP